MNPRDEDIVVVVVIPVADVFAVTQGVASGNLSGHPEFEVVEDTLRYDSEQPDYGLLESHAMPPAWE